jgi:tetratricopeptide (TPR) repeat protein
VKETFFSSKNITVIRSAGYNSNICVVTFMNLSPDVTNDRDREGFGANFIQSLRIDAYHVLCSGNDWYQYAEMTDSMYSLRDAIANYSTIVTYGSSMGGYAAIKYARLLGATRSIAISPQVSIDRRKVPFETRWANEAKRIKFIDDEVIEALTTAIHISVMFDPNDLDGRHVKMLRTGVAKLTTVPVPFAGHGAATFFRETGDLKGAMTDLILGSYNPSTWAIRRRKSRLSSPTYWRQIALYFLKKRKHRAAVEAAERSLKLEPNNTYTMSILATSLRRAGNWLAALTALENLIAIDPKNDKVQFVLNETRQKVEQLRNVQKP